MAVHSLNCFTHKFVSLAKMMVGFQEINIKIVGKFVFLKYSNMKQSYSCIYRQSSVKTNQLENINTSLCEQKI